MSEPSIRSPLFAAALSIPGSWEAFGRGTGSPTQFHWRVESRSALGGYTAPGGLGGAGVGTAALNSGFAYNDGFDTDISVLSWTQGFNDRRAGVAIGGC